MRTTPSEEAQTRENERTAFQEGKRDVAANVRLRESLLALLADAGVNSTDAMTQRLEDIGLTVTPEFSKKDIDGMRAAIRGTFIPSLEAVTQNQANRIGQDVKFSQVPAAQQATIGQNMNSDLYEF